MRSTVIHCVVNFETAGRERSIRPGESTERRDSKDGPSSSRTISHGGALAKHRIEIVSAEPDFQPWMDSYLVDAFLRERPLPERDTDLKCVYESWQRQWRPIALHALDAALRKHGLALTEIAIEQTVFKIVRKAEGKCFAPVVSHIGSVSRSGPGDSGTAVTLYVSCRTPRDDQDLAGNSEVALLIRRWESPVEAERFLGVHSGTSAPSLAVNQTCTGYRRH
jgi:hypothetical protein